MSLMWIGVLLHHYPVMTGRQMDNKLGYWFTALYTIGAMGGAWNQEGWITYGYLILIFGLCLAASFVVLGLYFSRSRPIAEMTSGGEAVPAE